MSSSILRLLARGWSRYLRANLVLRIIVGILLGAVLGLFAPYLTFFSAFGSIFVNLLESIAPILVFTLVIASLTKDEKALDSRFGSMVVLYFVSTFFAAASATAFSFLFPISIDLGTATAAPETASPQSIAEILANLLSNVAQNPVQAIATANYPAVLFWAIVFSLAFKRIGTSKTKIVVSEVASCVLLVVRWIIEMAPFGVMGLVFAAVQENGLESFKIYGKLISLLAASMFFVAFVATPLIVFLVLRRNPYPLVFKCLRVSGVTAFFTRSSAANIPVNLSLCEKLGLDRDFYSIAIPLGATVNMSGAAVTISVMTLATARSLNMTPDFPTAIILCLLSTLGACGASGVAGGSLLLIPMACSLFGISNEIAMQTVAVGFIIGVIQDGLETALNSSGDVMLAAAVDLRRRDQLAKGED